MYNAGRRSFNMMLAAGHVNPRGRALETSVGERPIIDCDFAPAMQARWAAESHICSLLTHVCDGDLYLY